MHKSLYKRRLCFTSKPWLKIPAALTGFLITLCDEEPSGNPLPAATPLNTIKEILAFNSLCKRTRTDISNIEGGAPFFPIIEGEASVIGKNREMIGFISFSGSRFYGFASTWFFGVSRCSVYNKIVINIIYTRCLYQAGNKKPAGAGLIIGSEDLGLSEAGVLAFRKEPCPPVQAKQTDRGFPLQ